MITQLSKDSLHKIDMLVIYRRDVERFLRAGTLELFKDTYGEMSCMPTQKTPQLVQVMEVMPLVAHYRELLGELEEEIAHVEEMVKKHRPGLFGRSRQEFFKDEYAHTSKTSSIAYHISKIQIDTERLLFVLQNDRSVYGKVEYTPSFLEAPQVFEDMGRLKDHVKKTHEILDSLWSYYEETQQKFEKAFEMVFIESFADFGFNAHTYKKFKEYMDINIRQHYKISQFADLFEQYCYSILTDIPENLALQVKEYHELLDLSTQAA